jgi:signal transduction histidine kinase
MKRNKDKRITASTFSIKQFLLISLTIFFVCSTYHIIYTNSIHNKPNSVLLAGLLLVSVSAVGAFLIGIVKRVYFDRSIIEIAVASQKVANGDFDINIPPHRKDGKKDEVELLIEDFNKMVSELKSVEILKNDFVVNVSHELKTPLSVIQNYANLLQDEKLPVSEKSEYATTIALETKKLTDLITNILKLSKLENQSIVVSGKPYRLDEQLRECVLAVEDLWSKKEITFNGDDINECTVSYDKALLEIIWNNLIANAIKFTPKKGSISISLKDNVISIIDSGCGMDEQTLNHIFDKFYQGDTSHNNAGNGLGLALVKKVCDLIGAKIEVSSILNKGTTFKIKLKH